MTLEHMVPYLIGVWTLIILCLAFREEREINKVYQEMLSHVSKVIKRPLTTQEKKDIYERAVTYHREQPK